MIRTFLFSVAIALSAAPALAQQNNGRFASYDALRDEMIRLMSARDIEALLVRFGGSDEMTPEQMGTLQSRIQELFPQDFKHADLVRQQILMNGWRKEMWVFYTGTRYLYVSVVVHEREDFTFSINFTFNSDFETVNKEF